MPHGGVALLEPHPNTRLEPLDWLTNPKVPDAYSGHSIYSILEGVLLELQFSRTRSDRLSSVFARANKSYSYYL